MMMDVMIMSVTVAVTAKWTVTGHKWSCGDATWRRSTFHAHSQASRSNIRLERRGREPLDPRWLHFRVRCTDSSTGDERAWFLWQHSINGVVQTLWASEL